MVQFIRHASSIFPELVPEYFDQLVASDSLYPTYWIMESKKGLAHWLYSLMMV